MGEHHLLAFYPITTSLQNTLWNQFGNHENRRLEFLQSWDCAKEDLLAVEEALGDQVNDAYIPEDAEYATHGRDVSCIQCRAFDRADGCRTPQRRGSAASWLGLTL